MSSPRLGDWRRLVTLDWQGALSFPFRDPAWEGKLAIGGALMLLCPPIGWTIALGYRRAVGIRLRSGAKPPLPEWSNSWWSFYTGGLCAVGVILGYYIPFMALYAATAFGPSLSSGSHLLPIALFYVLIAVFPPLFLPVLPALYSVAFPWVQLTWAEMVMLAVLFFATAFVLPAAFVQVSVNGQFRAAFRFTRVVRFIAQQPLVYCEAWVLSLTASAIGVALGPFAPWGLFWSYIVILHAFTEAFLRSGRPDAIAAFVSSPLLARIQGRAIETSDYSHRRAS